MQISRLILVLGTMISVVSCATPAFDPASESQKLLRRDAEWADLASAGKDVEPGFAHLLPGTRLLRLILRISTNSATVFMPQPFTVTTCARRSWSHRPDIGRSRE